MKCFSLLLLSGASLLIACPAAVVLDDDDDDAAPTPEPVPDPVFDIVEGSVAYEMTYTEGAAVAELGECTERYIMSGVDASENAPAELAALQEVCVNCTELLSVFFTEVEDECPGGAGMPADNRMSFDRLTTEGSVTLWWKAEGEWFELASGALDYDETSILYDNPDVGGWGPWGGNVTNEEPCRLIAPCRWDGLYTIEADLGSLPHPDDAESE